MGHQWWRSMKAYQRGNSWRHGNKFSKKDLKPFLLFLAIGIPKNQLLMLLIAMTPFMTSMASPNPCIRYFWYIFLSKFSVLFLFVNGFSYQGWWVFRLIKFWEIMIWYLGSLVWANCFFYVLYMWRCFESFVFFLFLKVFSYLGWWNFVLIVAW